MGAGESFTIYGNYFNIDTSHVPLVSSFNNEYADNYGTDGSNTQLIKVIGDVADEPGSTVVPTTNFNVKNLNLKGNANISDYVSVTASEETKSVYAGGLIFLKSFGVNVAIDNIITRTNFITFMPVGGNSNVVIKNTKAYDSYANAAYIWRENTVTFENCNFERAGGPLMLATHDGPEDGLNTYPIVTADDNCKFKNLVTGEEFWFKSYGANALLKDVRALNQVFVQTSQTFSGGALTKSFLTSNDDQGKFNMIYLLMPNGTDTSIVSKTGVQGSFTYKGYELNRMKNTQIGASVHAIHDGALMQGAYGVSFNLKDTFAFMNADMTPGTLDGNPMTLAGFVMDAQGNPLVGESYLTLNLGAISLFLEYFTI
jgi:hypothetical protein